MKLRSIKNVNVKNKKILLRIDINSPVKNKIILDNPRFQEVASTIKYLLKRGAKLAILAHQGREGDLDFTTLKQHAKLLSKYSKIEIEYMPYLFEDQAKEKISLLKQGEAILLENVRKYPDEKSLYKKRYKELFQNFDIYVNEAFSVSHRNDASIILPPKFLKSYIGLQFEKELSYLDKIKLNSGNLTILLGGAKVEDYFPILKLLKNKSNILLASGVLANLFYFSIGKDLGFESKWLESKGYDKFSRKLRKIYKKHKQQVVLPVDFGMIKKDGSRIDLTIEEFPSDYKIMDIGNKSIELFNDKIKKSKFIFMKGPAGFSEYKKFSTGTIKILKQISTVTKNKKIISILGGGHLSATVEKYNIPNNFTYISLSGGALIKYLAGEKLPGIKVLEKNKK